MIRHHPIKNKVILLCAVLLLSAGCSISLISKYDEVIDHGLTTFQKTMGLHLIQKQRTPIPQYRETFYDSVFVDLQSLQTRASSVPKNSQTIAIIGILKEQVQSVKTRDSSGNSSAAFFRIAKENIDQNCQDALTLELAKKRGE